MGWVSAGTGPVILETPVQVFEWPLYFSRGVFICSSMHGIEALLEGKDYTAARQVLWPEEKQSP